MAIKEKLVYVTDDGTTHNTEIMAKQHEAFGHLCNEFKGFLGMFPQPDPDQIVNEIYNHRACIRAYLDMTEQMMNESMVGG